MKILFVSSSSGSRGGGELYLLFLAEALLTHRVKVGLWCSTHSRMDELAESFSRLGKVYRSEYINTYDYKMRSIRYLFPKTIRGMKEAIDDFIPDVIHVNKQNLEDGLDLVMTLDKFEIPYVSTIHITQTERSLGAYMGGLRDFLSKETLRRAKSLKWITISPNRSRDLINFLGRIDKVVMIPNGVRIESDEGGALKRGMRKKLKIPENNLVVISVGRLEKQKDPLKFVDWARQCLMKNKNLNFYWIGDGSLRSNFEELISGHKLSAQIQCVGWQNDVKPFYAMADIYLHTANFEGLPFSLLEAMSWKIPCVVSRELYEDLSFPKEVIYRDIGGLELFVNHTDIRVNTGDSAYEYIKQNFSLETISGSYLSIYKSVTS